MAALGEDKPAEYAVNEGNYQTEVRPEAEYQVLQDTNTEELMDADQKSTFHLDFFRKVLGIVSLQVVITAAVIAIFISSEDTSDWLIENFWLAIVTFCVGLVLLFLPICVKPLASRVPYNYLNLMTFVTFTQTTCIAITLSIFCCMVPVMVVVCAGVGTIYITLAMAVASWFVPPMQVTSKRSLACSTLTICLFDMALFMGFGFSQALNISPAYTVFFIQMICAFGSLLYGIYIFLDLVMILTGNRYGVTSDDYILAAIVVYIDMLRVFIFLLRVLGSKR